MSIRLEVTGADQGTLAAFLRALGDEETSFADLARIAAQDAGFAASVLKLANSSYYGLAGAVDRLEFACAVVGMLGLRSLTVAELARRQGPYPTELAAFTSALVSEVSQRARPRGVDAQLALSAALVATLGWIIAAQQDAVGYARLVELPPAQRGAFEVERWGERLVRLTQRALVRWEFPDAIVEAVGELDGIQEPSVLGALLRESWEAAALAVGPVLALSVDD